MRGVDVEAAQLDLRDRIADCRQRIAPDDDDPAERGLPEQQRREQRGGLVGGQMLDVVDHEDARVLRQRRGERSRHAPQRPLGARAHGRGAIAGEALDDRERHAERRRELGDEPRLAGAMRAVQRHQRRDRERIFERGELGLPTDKRHRTDGAHGMGGLRARAHEREYSKR